MPCTRRHRRRPHPRPKLRCRAMLTWWMLFDHPTEDRVQTVADHRPTFTESAKPAAKVFLFQWLLWAPHGSEKVCPCEGHPTVSEAENPDLASAKAETLNMSFDIKWQKSFFCPWLGHVQTAGSECLCNHLVDNKFPSNRKLALVGLLPNQILFSFSSAGIRQRSTLGALCVFVWSGCQFFYLCRSWKRREFD